MTWSDRRYDVGYEREPRAGAVTKGIIVACVALWLLEQLVGRSGQGQIEHYFALSHRGLISGSSFFFWQPFTYMFLHDPDGLLHILFNMLLLWWTGPSVEAALGRRRFVHLYVWAGVLGGLAHLLFMPSRPVVGASAAIMGVMVVFAVLFPNVRFLFMFVFPMKAKHMVMLMIGIDLLISMRGGSGVASIAHLGGALFGYLFLKLGPIVQTASARWREAKLHNNRRREETEREKVDEILDKISRTGMTSLTQSERDFLLKASKNYRDRTGME